MKLVNRELAGIIYEAIEDLVNNADLVNVNAIMCRPSKVKELELDIQDKILKLEIELKKTKQFIALLNKTKEEDPELWI